MSDKKITRISRLFARLLLGLTAALAVSLVSPASAGAVGDPSGSGASAATVMWCDSQSHTLWEQATAYSTITTVERRIWFRLTGSPKWSILYIDGSARTAGWLGVGGGTFEGQNLNSLAGLNFYVYVEYAFTPIIATTAGQTSYAAEYPQINYWNPYSRQWLRGSYCGL